MTGAVADLSQDFARLGKTPRVGVLKVFVHDGAEDDVEDGEHGDIETLSHGRGVAYEIR